jgi:hypothetical protein
VDTELGFRLYLVLGVIAVVNLVIVSPAREFPKAWIACRRTGTPATESGS